jgi:hypothetical protein
MLPQKDQLNKEQSSQNINDGQQQQQQQPNQTGIPDNLKASMEYMSGVSLADVRVEYNSDKPEQMQAHAYTQGTKIYIAPGQEKHLAHELWHVVQQKGGRVKKTVQFKKDAPGNDNQSLEGEADKKGQEAMKMAKIPELLPQKELEHQTTAQDIVQRVKVEKESHYGKFYVDDAAYDFTTDKRSLNAHISFEPGDNTDATKIGLTQSISAQKAGKVAAIDPNSASKMSATGERIDRLSDKDNPVYGSASLGEGKELKDTAQNNNTSGKPTDLKPGANRNATYDLGHHYKKKPTDADWTSKDAGLFDGPTTQGAANSKKEFETTALALDGKQKGEYYGSVKWGWERDGANKLKKIPFEIVSKGVPSKDFMGAAKKWNDGKTRGTYEVINDDTDVESLTSSAILFKLKAGDQVVQEGTLSTNTTAFVALRVSKAADESLVGKRGSMDVKFLKDIRDGDDTIKLPIVKTKLTTAKDVSLYKDKDRIKKKKLLEKDTRMKVLKEDTDADMVQIEIVDGANTGDTGWIKKSQMKDE